MSFVPSIQPRDYRILVGLLESRVMSLAHVTGIYFEGRLPSATKRIQKLKEGGLVGERKKRIGEPSILFLTRKGFRALELEGLLEPYPALSASALDRRGQVSELTLRHELQVMDVKQVFFDALRSSPKLSIAEFSTWPALYQFQAIHPVHRSQVSLKPDGFIRIHETEDDGGKSEHAFFLEVDRSTEVIETIAAKAACYIDYYKSGGYAKRCGGPADQYRDYPFRVLVVCKSKERVANLMKRMLANVPPVRTQIWFTTFSELLKDMPGQIWRCPEDISTAHRRAMFPARG